MSDVPVAQALAIEIRAQHLLARQAADTAIDHARRAGMLLLQAKAALDHGEWLPWLAEHCALSMRQAQRYMRAAQGKPPLPRARRYDTASHFDDGTFHAARLAETLAYGLPLAGDQEAVAQLPDGDVVLVQPADTRGHFFVTRVSLASFEAEGLSRPIRQDAVGAVLTLLRVPTDARWARNIVEPLRANPWVSNQPDGANEDADQT